MTMARSAGSAARADTEPADSDTRECAPAPRPLSLGYNARNVQDTIGGAVLSDTTAAVRMLSRLRTYP